MPNQLAACKRRQSLAEHRAVLAALAEIARLERTTVMALLRQAGRAAVRRHVADPARAEVLRAAVWAYAPRLPAGFTTAAQVARFKRSQREFDQLVVELGLAGPEHIQARNSAIAPTGRLRILELDRNHASSNT